MKPQNVWPLWGVGRLNSQSKNEVPEILRILFNLSCVALRPSGIHALISTKLGEIPHNIDFLEAMWPKVEI